MKSLAPHDRPREKLARLGSGVLGDNELLAVVLGHGFRRDSALEIANRVLVLSDGVQGLTRVTERQLHKVDGIGPAKAAQVLAAIELGRRTLTRAPSGPDVARQPARRRGVSAAGTWIGVGRAIRDRAA